MKPILLLALIASSPAIAARWVAIGATDWPPTPESKMIVEVDLDSIKMRDGLRQAWTRYNYNPPQQSMVYGRTKGSAVGLELFDCKNEESATMTGTDYAEAYGAGDTFNSFQFTRQRAIQNMKAPIPGSFGEGTLKFVCARPLK